MATDPERMSPASIRLLCFVRERYPTHRVDIEELLGRELVGRGHAIDLVMQADKEETGAGVRPWHGRSVLVGPTDNGNGFLPRLRRQWLGLTHDLKALWSADAARYDAIQVRDKYLFAAVALWVARRRGLRFYFWMSFPEAEAQMQRVQDGTARYAPLTAIRARVFWWLLYRRVLPHCDHAFVQSEQMRRDVMATGVRGDLLTAVPMGISRADIERFSALRTSRGARGSAGGPLTVVYLGTLVARRQLVVLVDMLGELLKAGLDCRLLCVGDGERAEDRDRLSRRARELGVDHAFEITGFMPRDAALALTARADIAVSPFFPTPVLNSTSPTKLVEYMALELPVVANDHPEQRLILGESRAGVRVPWGARHFARAVRWLADLGPEGRAAMGERGRQWVLQHRTYASIADIVEAKYLEHLGVGSRRQESGLRGMRSGGN